MLVRPKSDYLNHIQATVSHPRLKSSVLLYLQILVRAHWPAEEQLNFFKFSTIVVDEFPKVLRQTQMKSIFHPISSAMLNRFTRV